MEPELRARRIAEQVAALDVRATAPMRRVRRAASRDLRGAPAAEVRAVACALIREHGLGWIGYELIAAHAGAFASLVERDLEAMADGLASWGAVDAYGTIIAGPAWKAGRVGDGFIARWSASPDRWLRRLSLVATVPLARAGDARRTLEVCRRLASDRDDMVVKALSWSLRELAKPDPEAVRRFLAEQGERLAPRVRREVCHKLATGLKAPRRRGV